MENKKYIYSIYSLVENPADNTINDKVICPICKELKLDPKISNCINICQFSVCGECAKKLNKCPMCKNSPEWNDDSSIEQLLPTVEFQCQECQKVLHVDDLKNHCNSHTPTDAGSKNKILIDEKNILKEETNKKGFNHVKINSNEDLINKNTPIDINPENIIRSPNPRQNWKYSTLI